jgi:hypothetical protein
LRACFARANFLVREDFEVLDGVFISYRREDSGGFAGRIYDRLTSRLGRDGVFFDVDNIPPGEGEGDRKAFVQAFAKQCRELSLRKRAGHAANLFPRRADLQRGGGHPDPAQAARRPARFARRVG